MNKLFSKFEDINFLLENSDFEALRDFLDLAVGKCIGSGFDRIVYESKTDPNIVFKFAKSHDTINAANYVEWDLWQTFKNSKIFGKFLAPCHSISKTGLVLVQSRTKPLKDPDLVPKRLPNFIADAHFHNFGYFEDRIVCHDYAYNYADVVTYKNAKIVDYKQNRVEYNRIFSNEIKKTTT